MKGKVFVVTRTLASFLPEGSIVRITEILEDALIIERADNDGIISTIQLSASMKRHLHLIYAE